MNTLSLHSDALLSDNASTQNCNDSASLLPRWHREFYRIALDDSAPWQRSLSDGGLIEYLTLCDNLNSALRKGSRTRLSRWSPGASIANPVQHDFYEEVFILSGSLSVGAEGLGSGGEVFPAPSYACRPPGVLHGPFSSVHGCTMLEFYYYE